MFTSITIVLLVTYSNKTLHYIFMYFQVNSIKIDFSLTTYFILMKY